MITLKAISPEGTLFEGEVSAAFLPGALGEFEVLPAHAPIISSLTKGRLRYRLADGKEQSIALSSGFVSFDKGNMTVCLEPAK